MKKTLIALAALAAFGTASAQSTVTISGNLAAGFAGDTTSAGVKTGGYGMDSNITLSVVEDLGGGLTAYGSMSIENFSEDVPTNGNGVTLGLRGGFGSVAFSSAEGSDFLPVDGLTASSDGTDADRITYTTPKISGFTFALTHQDAIDAGTVFAPLSITSVGALHPAEIDADRRGVSSVLTGSVNYTVGPVAIDAVHADFQGSLIASRTGVRGAYDFGMAKLTYGMMKQKNVTSGSDVTETGLTIAAPLGPVTASYSYATSKTEGSSLTKKGNALTVSYALSKRSSLALYSEEYDTPGSGSLTASKTKEYSLLLKHSF